MEGIYLALILAFSYVIVCRILVVCFVSGQCFTIFYVCKNLFGGLMSVSHWRMDFEVFISLPKIVVGFILRLRANASKSNGWIAIFLLKNIIILLPL